jgi:prepilin-type processing-associated H-X9-DG protein
MACFTLVAHVLLAPSPNSHARETLKEYPRENWTHVATHAEVKTLRRKLSRLAARKGGHALGREIAQRRIREHGRVVGFLYVDGHVRAYHGKHTIPKAYVTRARLAAPDHRLLGER